MGVSIFDERTPLAFWMSIDNTTGIGHVPLNPADVRDQRWDAIIASNNDTIDHVVIFTINNDLPNVAFGSVTVPAGAGFGTGPAIDCVAALPTAAVAGIVVPAGTVVAAVPLVAMSAGKLLVFGVMGGYL